MVVSSLMVAFSVLACTRSAPIQLEPYQTVPNDLDSLEEYLTVLLETDSPVPLVWVDEAAMSAGEEVPLEPSTGRDNLQEEETLWKPWKRSRYYRRYPWKRQNGRNSGYDPDGYLCSPSREDVFQLLMAIHEARNGNHEKTLNFCNRKRPAKAVFTNIRFVGRRKK
ncbi:hypothetical protein AAG570_001647 [Ranatra chinensis]|uniref:Uncharacterized protein n=1 Tax=Ranatra chinensis TaxID=642074 RepID=A0ABD0YN62_9HEMI